MVDPVEGVTPLAYTVAEWYLGWMLAPSEVSYSGAIQLLQAASAVDRLDEPFLPQDIRWVEASRGDPRH